MQRYFALRGFTVRCCIVMIYMNTYKLRFYYQFIPIVPPIRDDKRKLADNF